MGKTFNKYRQNRDYYDDEFIYDKDNKKRKKENAELRKMRMRNFDDDAFGQNVASKNPRYR